ncbi:MAG: flagella basal body P-ring formation protein FlgA, partial [Hydrogenobaculum sp.]
SFLPYVKPPFKVFKHKISQFTQICFGVLIRYGDAVRVIYDNGYIRITTEAKTMQNGYLGKFIGLQPP